MSSGCLNKVTNMLISTDKFLQSKTKVSLGLASGEASLRMRWRVFPLILVIDDQYLIVYFLKKTIQIPNLMSLLIRILRWGPCLSLMVDQGSLVSLEGTDFSIQHCHWFCFSTSFFSPNIFTLKILLCVHMEVRIQLGKWVLSFHYVAPWDLIETIRLSSRYPIR